MQIKQITDKDNITTLTVVPTSEELAAIKTQVLTKLQDAVKVAGFREGKAPLEMVEKNVDPTRLQSEFLESAIEQLYPQAAKSEDLRPVDRPTINVTKFVPFDTLEFEAKVPVLGEIKLADYKSIKMAKPTVKVTEEDVKGVLDSIQQRMAEKKEVKRAAKEGDEVWIDFSGKDAKGQPVKGADGNNYPVKLGSNTFIPGFEENLVGLKAGEKKEFSLTFPKEYGVKAIAGKKVTFNAEVKKVQEVIEPKVDDDFAAKVGPFKNVKELKDDIKKQLTIERQKEFDQKYQSDLVREITKQSTVTAPKKFVEEQIERMLEELQQNLSYRGQTYDEFLASEVTTDEKYREEILRPAAEERVKASLILGEIADTEKLMVTPEELDIRMQLLKGQHQDPNMQAELDKPEAKEQVASQLLTEKTIAKIVDYSNKK